MPPGSVADRLPGEPDPTLTPGALNPDVTQATISSTICVSGWTATVRPDSSYTDDLKVEQISEYGYEETSTTLYEEDHLIPLELGGAPSDPRNLWPEPYTASLPDGRSTGANTKDVFETELKKEVCAGSVTLAAAQAEIGDDWVHSYYSITLPPTPTPPATPYPTEIPTPQPTPSPTTVAGGLKVAFVAVPNPASVGGPATVTAFTSPGAKCSIKVTLPSGHVSTVAALRSTQTASDDGLVSWTWTITSNTKPGKAKLLVTCSLGGTTVSAATTFQMV
jgi:hypothetical protein